MVKNYLLVALRTFSKNKYHFLLNVTGLVLGISCFAALGLFVRNELTYDTCYKDHDNIYRVTTHIERNGSEINWAVTTGALATTLKENVAGVKEATKLLRVQREFDFVIDNRIIVIPERTGFYTDANVFNIFNFRILAGDSDMLARPNSIVLTESFAKKLFGTTDVLGKMFASKESEKDSIFAVTGLLADLPQNSHIQFDFLLSGTTHPEWKMRSDKKNGGGMYVYFKTFPGVRQADMVARVKDHVATDYEAFTPGRQYPIQKLTDIYFNANNLFEHRKGNINFVKILSVVALFIITISIINYVLLSTAQSLYRAREIGVRKVLGSSRRRLFGQFLAEAMIVALVAGMIALFVIELLLRSAFPVWFDIHLSLWSNPTDVVIVLALSAATGVLAGLFPALKITTFNTILTLKGKVQQQKKLSLRSLLITLQFVFTASIIAGNLVLLRQVAYLKAIDPGFEKDEVINVRRSEIATQSQWNAFKTAVAAQSSVKNSGITASRFIGDYNTLGIRVLSADAQDTTVLLSQYNMVEPNTIPTVGIRILEGRNFSPAFSTDSTAIIINETAKKALGIDNIIGLDVICAFIKGHGKVIGVMEDYHFQTFDKAVAPTVFLFDLKGWESQLLIKFASKDHQQALQAIEKCWRESGMDSPLQYVFLDDWFARLTKKETELSSMVSLFAMISVVITMLGLLGVISYGMQQRRKEIGIRKVLGASVNNILVMINKKYLGYIAVAFVLAIPLSWYGISKWLESFAYRVTITWSDYLFTAAVVLAVSILTISLQSLRAAYTDPVDTLKEE